MARSPCVGEGRQILRRSTKHRAKAQKMRKSSCLRGKRGTRTSEKRVGLRILRGFIRNVKYDSEANWVSGGASKEEKACVACFARLYGRIPIRAEAREFPYGTYQTFAAQMWLGCVSRNAKQDSEANDVSGGACTTKGLRLELEKSIEMFLCFKDVIK